MITDLPVEVTNIAWYRVRAWVEAGFKNVKRGGWGWHPSLMQEASRVERLWLAMAVALVWMVHLDSQANSQLPLANVESLPVAHIARRRMKSACSQPPARRLSCPQRGPLVLLAALVQAEDWSLGAIIAEPWPEIVTPLKRVASSAKVLQQAKKQARKRRYKAARRRKRAA